MLCASLRSAALLAVWFSSLAPTRGEDAKEVKPVATAKDVSRSARIGSFHVTTGGVVIRSAEELVARTSKEEDAKNPKVQKEMEAELAKLLKVEAIDWNKHAVVGVIGESIDSLSTDGKTLTVTFTPYKEPLARAVPPTPKVLVLIERPAGEVKFVKKK